MYNIEETSFIIKYINEFRNGAITEAQLTTKICDYFDLIKDTELTPSDMKFLKYISNIVGIPHYYDLLIQKFQQNNKEFDEFNLNTFASLLYESSLHIDDNIKLHKHQMSILDRFNNSRQNRIFLSASTSFGKTYLVYEVIKKMKYSNIVLMFPTIALLSENLEKIKIDEYYKYFRDNYKIHTLSQFDEEDLAENNIFIFTPERYLSFLDKNTLSFDFIFMDEIYKIDNEYIIDNDEAKENERDTAYRVALYNALNNNTDMLLVGPYIEISKNDKENYNPSFEYFLKENNFELLLYNDYEIVNKQRNILHNTKQSKKDKLKYAIKSFVDNKENCIVYCKGSGTAESKVKEIIKVNEIDVTIDISKIEALINHIHSKFHADWVITKALQNGIGIHHGLVPKYLQKEIINLFNDGTIKVLFSTTTITEGVNTSAKNLIVFDHKKGDKDLKKFDAKNIEGRAGRFMHHYSGNVLIIDKKFDEIINADDIGIKHKNYDENSPKDEVDYFITDDKYLSSDNINSKIDILNQIIQRQIPIEIFNAYKVISYSDKIKLFDIVNNLTIIENQNIKKLIASINGQSVTIDFIGFDLIIKLLLPIVKNQDLKNLIERKKYSELDNRQYSILTFLLYFYLRDGFKGLVDFKINKQKNPVDDAIRESSRFVYNTLKYQLVKYLGVFNILYKYIRSKKENKEDIIGIDKLLSKLEHNAFTKVGKLASDYGVPYQIVNYYDTLEINQQVAQQIKEKFDGYEKKAFENFERILDK
ncbi:DEAD/DEAH box helicase family protein [Aliarcobacter butzleri]|uniref:DEAD/DEAH box helicase family protein n=1 Tax=Aliarcobacter butzleri TaxID=28197 RepID=UPI00263D217E|nr:DEAD/DEAH box helicase family protein [Aliarcobacter butzleri]MDN5060910.1 DEAD/DEAH box helicase family protein [Aliarcobacter butzleri]